MLNVLEDLDVDGDISSHHYMFVNSNQKIKEDYEIIKEIYGLANPGRKNYSLKGATLKAQTTSKKEGKVVKNKLKKAQVEQALYRLKQLGVVIDWTISGWSGAGAFELEFSNYSDSLIKDSLLSTIGKYDKEFSFENVMSNEKYSTYKQIIKASERENATYIDQYILLLLYWSYDNFGYNRRQSLKNIYENTCQFADGEITGKEFKIRLENYFKFTQLTTKFQNIADNPNDFKDWFDVFYKIDRKNKTKKFITLKQQEEERDSLSRFLESYMHNDGLDLISGLIRLLLDDYDNSDGKSRLESSLKQIKNFSTDDQSYVVDEIIKIGMYCDEKNKSLLSESLYNIVNDSKEFLFKLSLELEDSFSTCKLLTDINKKLTTINEENYGRLEKIG
jgi:ATP-dependent DNA helicase RecQ